MDEAGPKILVKVVECILQSRIEVQKKQIRHFDQINKQILNYKYKHQHQPNLDHFLNSLLLAEKYNLMPKIAKQASYHSITIQFRLINTQTGAVVQAQIWAIEFQQFRPPDDDHNQQKYQTITGLFEDLIVFLNRQPLFSEYQSNHKMKGCFNIEYQMHINDASSSKLDFTILTINRKHTRQRVCRSFVIKLSCDFIDPLIDCNSASENFKFTGKNDKAEEGETIDSLRGKEVVSINQKNGKYNVYEFYDKDLDFVFLSSDDETFKKSPKVDVKQINISSQIDDTDEFELLVVSKDEEFLDDTKLIFSELSANELKYFTN